MKNWITFLACVLVFFSIKVSAQNGETVEPNDRILASFEKKYMGSEEKLIFGWRKVNDLVIVTFTHKGLYKYCSFKSNGIWQEAGESYPKEKISESVRMALPELDITAFIVESFRINTYADKNGYMILFETDVDRIEIVIADNGKILRQDKYPIPEKLDDDNKEKDPNAVEWDDGE